MIVKTQKAVKLPLFRLKISGVHQNGIVVGRVKIVCCQLHQLSAEQSMAPMEALMSPDSTRVETQDSRCSRNKC
jgi:hypothetical protein